MARGFESKSVADQQEAAQNRSRRAPEAAGAVDPAKLNRRRSLDLALADVRRRLGSATAPGHRAMLERALAALEKEIGQIS